MNTQRNWLASALLSALLVTGCTVGAGSGPGTLSAVGNRTVSLTTAGNLAPTNLTNVPVVAGNLAIEYNSDSKVASVHGTIEFQPTSTASGWATVDLTANLFGYEGSVVVGGDIAQSASVSVNAGSVSADDDGDVSVTVDDGTTSIALSTVTNSATGIEAAYDALIGSESSWCREAQQTLSGQTEAQLPLASLANTTHSSRSAFGSSKALITPLTTQTWVEKTGVDTAEGHNLVISKQMNCKTRSADHLAASGYPSGTPTTCGALASKALDTAWAALTQVQRDAFTATGVTLGVGGDVYASAGVEWLTPIPSHTVNATTVTQLPHALAVGWNDPSYQFLADSIRGVHYCTTWSPAYAYWWYTKGAFGL